MKICPICKNKNYIKEDFCERCNQSIQNINHEPFRFPEFLSQYWYFYVPAFAILGIVIKYFNTSDLVNQAVFLMGISSAIIILMYLFYVAYLYDNPKNRRKSHSGHLLVFYLFNIFFILGILYFAVQDQLPIPAILMYIALPVSILIFTENKNFNKDKIVSWAFTLSWLCYELFIIGLYLIMFYVNYNISPDLFYWQEIGLFSLAFLFLGIFMGGFVSLGLQPPFNPSSFFNYLFWSNPRDYLLEGFLYGTVFLLFVFLPTILRAIYHLPT